MTADFELYRGSTRHSSMPWMEGTYLGNIPRGVFMGWALNVTELGLVSGIHIVYVERKLD